MRTIQAETITEAVKNLCIKACHQLPDDVYNAFHLLKETDKSPSAKLLLAVLFVELGQDVHVNGNLEKALHEGVRQGYTEGYLRKSVVAEPLFERINTKDNTPAIIHYSICEGDTLKIRMAPKGAGSENKSMLKMLVPADGMEGVKKFVLETVKIAGPNSCPPLVIGIGLGGTMEIAALNAKKACVQEFLTLINKTGIGVQGLGGTSTAIRVHIEWSPTHIACLPVAVNINCHAARHAEIIL